jgi:glycosyltransferase involved in cell wall biosynthesis
LISHRHDGWICEASTPEALADGLEFFLADARRREASGKAALESARAFDAGAYATAWREVFA